MKIYIVSERGQQVIVDTEKIKLVGDWKLKAVNNTAVLAYNRTKNLWVTWALKDNKTYAGHYTPKYKEALREFKWR